MAIDMEIDIPIPNEDEIAFQIILYLYRNLKFVCQSVSDDINWIIKHGNGLWPNWKTFIEKFAWIILKGERNGKCELFFFLSPFQFCNRNIPLETK